MNTTVSIAEIVRRIVAVSNPEKIVLFGSHARNEARPESDLDLLVILNTADHLRQESWQMRRALRGLLVPIDIVVATAEQIERLSDVPD